MSDLPLSLTKTKAHLAACILSVNDTKVIKCILKIVDNIHDTNDVPELYADLAFEEMVKELANIALSDTDIEVVLQRDLNNLIKSKELGNEPRDISWLKEQIKSNIFDLYCIVNTGDKKQCFGCVQCKTSIRDRVTRDREPSIHAMQSFFWSIIFVLDGDFLKLPKFMSMVNGGSEEFPANGWHEMYVFSEDKTNDRIHPINVDFEIFKKHALQASKQWLKQRQWFNSEWKSN